MFKRVLNDILCHLLETPVVYLETLVFQVVAAYKGWDSKQVNEDILKIPFYVKLIFLKYNHIIVYLNKAVLSSSKRIWR